jgi:hypothetical protein
VGVFNHLLGLLPRKVHLMIGIFHLMRLFGISLILGFLIATVKTAGDGRWEFAILSCVCVALGLYVAVLGDKGISRRKAEAAIKRKQAALNFNGMEFSAGLRWIRAIFFMALSSSLGAFALLASVTCFLQGKFLVALFLAVSDVILGISALSFLVTAYVAYRDKCLVRMNTLGLTLWGRSPIEWKVIDGIDLKEMEVKDQKQYHLVLAIQSEYFSTHPFSKMLTWLHWSAPRPALSSRTLAFPCTLLNTDPQLLVQAAKVIADRSGCRRVKDWSHYIPIDEAIAYRDRRSSMEGASRGVDRLMSRLQVLDTKTPSGLQEMQEIDRKLQAALKVTSEMNDANLKAFELHANQTKVRLTKVKWAIGLLFFFVFATIVLKIFSALSR